MIVQRIAQTTRVLGKAQGYFGLPVRDEMANGMHMMRTAWQPTPDELVRLLQGANVELVILGTGHPPVLVQVGAVGGDEGDEGTIKA